MGIVSTLFLSCQKATFLVSKQQETQLSLLEELRLKAHLSMCTMCTNFKIQTDAFTINLKKKGSSLYSNKEQDMSDNKKEELKNLIISKIKES